MLEIINTNINIFPKMKLFISSEDKDIENRVCVTPDIAKKFASQHQVYVEQDAGINSGFSNEEYELSEAKVVSRNEISEAEVVFAVNPLGKETINLLKKNTIVIGSLDPFNNIDKIKEMKEKCITSFSLDFIPRTTRAQYMDILSSQASLAGYKAVIEASHILNRAIPLMMTTAGTIPAAKVLVIGAGVAGLQAIATAKRLGAIVSAFDVRTSAKEQVESLGAKFIEVNSREKIDGVYAKEMSEDYKRAQEQKLKDVLPFQDIVITTAQIPGKKAPVIIKNEMIECMKKDTVIIDLAAKSGGNCELTVLGRTIEKNGIKIVGFENILNLIPFDASRLFAKNIFSFFELLTSKLQNNYNLLEIDDEILKSTLITFNGQIENERLKGLC